MRHMVLGFFVRRDGMIAHRDRFCVNACNALSMTGRRRKPASESKGDAQQD